MPIRAVKGRNHGNFTEFLLEAQAVAHYERSKPGGWVTMKSKNEIKFAYIAVFPLDEFEEGNHVGTAEVVGRLQAREEAPPRQPLEVVLADVLKSELHPELHPI